MNIRSAVVNVASSSGLSGPSGVLRLRAGMMWISGA
jgi:hypothetical protein